MAIKLTSEAYITQQATGKKNIEEKIQKEQRIHTKK